MTPEPINSSAKSSSVNTSAMNFFTAAEPFDSMRTLTELRLPDGRLLHIPTALLIDQSLAKAPQPASTSPLTAGEEEPTTVPIIEEHLNVGKRSVVTGTVRLEKHVGVYEEALDIPLAVRSFEVERIVLNKPVDTAPAIRQEGETTVYPLIEEQLVLTKQLILREELRVTRRDTEVRDTRTISLRRESIEVTRT